MPHAPCPCVKILLFFDYLVSSFTKSYIFLIDAFSQKIGLKLKTWKPMIVSRFAEV